MPGLRFGLEEAILVVLAILTWIAYILTLQKALETCSPESRKMAPKLVWLLLVPLFSVVWHFFVVSRLATSLDNEFKRRNLLQGKEPARSLGLAVCVLTICTAIPLLGLVFFYAGLACGVLYWWRIARLTRELSAPRNPGVQGQG